MIISLLELELPVLWLAYLKAELAARAKGAAKHHSQFKKVGSQSWEKRKFRKKGPCYRPSVQDATFSMRVQAHIHTATFLVFIGRLWFNFYSTNNMVEKINTIVQPLILTTVLRHFVTTTHFVIKVVTFWLKWMSISMEVKLNLCLHVTQVMLYFKVVALYFVYIQIMRPNSHTLSLI